MSNIIKKILGNDKEYIPHNCAFCRQGGLYHSEEGRNYIYFKGEYYHYECFKNKPKRGRHK